MAKYCGSSYLQKQFVAEQKIHTKPVTINMPNLRIQYFPIKNILRSIIAQYPWLIESIQKEKERKFVPEQDRVHFRIKNELDTTDKDMFDRLVGKLRVKVSFDDFSFMGKNGRKFFVGYMSCSNLPFHDRTKRNKIYMFLMVQRPNPDLPVANFIEQFGHYYNYREPKPCSLLKLNGITRHNIMPPELFHVKNIVK